ncbi:DUF6653 family protein [Myceligenerans pegani]|uniref:Transmembrane protein n=1 Tax=Myceligenerans pegani TaxID=2776917 RepID=A0ABR9N1N1_9MICO|nr:DUF6653 family protein [Myceligenerans sp. TRM 65318]MBE1877560.1 hypothetical protein [Myceligenerans sp. TRM 65318]MBE3019831.1 hypothetical protein [Myceligenerans sp. TRM 65318]
MDMKDAVAGAHGMTDDTWKRHANPWSVWTRLAAIVVFELAVWSREWIGWWCLIGVALVMVWLFWLNVRVFGPVEPTSWAARGIYGEQMHVEGGLPAEHLVITRILVALGLVGFGLIAWGLVALNLWPLVSGTVLLLMAQLWRIDRYGLLYQQRA